MELMNNYPEKDEETTCNDDDEIIYEGKSTSSNDVAHLTALATPPSWVAASMEIYKRNKITAETARTVQQQQKQQLEDFRDSEKIREKYVKLKRQLESIKESKPASLANTQAETSLKYYEVMKEQQESKLRTNEENKQRAMESFEAARKKIEEKMAWVNSCIEKNKKALEKIDKQKSRQQIQLEKEIKDMVEEWKRLQPNGNFQESFPNYKELLGEDTEDNESQSSMSTIEELPAEHYRKETEIERMKREQEEDKEEEELKKKLEEQERIFKEQNRKRFLERQEKKKQQEQPKVQEQPKESNPNKSFMEMSPWERLKHTMGSDLPPQELYKAALAMGIQPDSPMSNIVGNTKMKRQPKQVNC